MPSQAPSLMVVARLPQAPGAVVLSLSDLTANDLIAIINAGALNAVVELSVLQSYLFGPFNLPSRDVLTNATAVFAATDVMLLIDKTVAGATPITLPTPALNRVIGIKDKKGDAGSNNITLDAGTGKLINGQQTLVMNANYGTTLLLGMSDTVWGTLI